MSNAFNFSERVRRVIAVSRSCSLRLHHEYVGTEHLLLGLLREREGVAFAVLQTLGVDLADLTESIEGMLQPGNSTLKDPLSLPFTSRAKKVLELAMAEAHELGHGYVGTEHLLLGLLREEKGIGAQMLGQAGVLINTARAETLRALGTPPVDTEIDIVAPRPRIHPSATGIATITIVVRLTDGSLQCAEFPTVTTAVDYLRKHGHLSTPGNEA